MTEHSLLQDASSNGEARANLFPQYLMKLLNDEVATEALWWLPDGLAFALDPNKINEQVLDKHFQKTKYSSFIRRLHNEGFRRQTRKYKKMEDIKLPEGTVVLNHDLFQKEKPELLESFYKSTPAAAAAKESKVPPVSASKALVQAAKARMTSSGTSVMDTGVYAPGQLDSLTTRLAMGNGMAGVAPNMAAAGSMGGVGGLAGLDSSRLQFNNMSFDELRQARMQREFLEQSMGINQLLKTYQGRLPGGPSPFPSSLMTSQTQMSRSSSNESSVAQQQAAASKEATMRSLVFQQQLNQRQHQHQSATAASSLMNQGGFAMDSQVNRLHQLEMETRRRRLQLEHDQQLSAADALRRFTNMSN